MRKIVLKDTHSEDGKSKDVNLIEKIKQKNTSVVSLKHGNYKLEILSWIENISNLKNAVDRSFSKIKKPNREIFVNKKISQGNLKELHWKIKGYYLLVYRRFLLKVDYVYEHNITVNE